MLTDVTAASVYAKLETDRNQYLNRARQCALLTIPSLLPPEGHTGSTVLPTPYQSVGARGVNNLASKLLLSLLPPNAPFFRLMISDEALKELSQDEGAKTKAEAALASMEKSVTDEADVIGLRSPIFEAMRLLVITGDVLLQIPASGSARVHPLTQYVNERDPSGTILRTIIKESVGLAALPEDIRKAHAAKTENSVTGEMASADTKSEYVDVYTSVTLHEGMHVVYQELDGAKIEGTDASYKQEESPFIALRWTRIDGENYGRGYIEEYLGDLSSLDGLSQSLLEGAALSARCVFAVSPGGPRVIDLVKAENGDYVEGDGTLVRAIQVDKAADLSVAASRADTIERRLAQAFLMNTSVQRPGERVTAEEIRFVAGELEDALGGIYSILSQEFQRPLVARLMGRMQKAGLLPKLPKGTIRLSISTGLEALGRGHDLQRLSAFVETVGGLGPEAMSMINISDLVTRIGTSLGISMTGLVKTPEQMAEEQAAAQQAAQQDKLLDGVKGAIPGIASKIADAATQPTE